jgi:predicted AAA+ superfamily ATPase
LLLGPRQTGKSTLIKALQPELQINLADEQTFLDFSRNPRELKERLAAGNYRTVFLDEIQRLPSLLNTLQAVLDEKMAPKFYLTGSSARKLKRGKANLLPGRVHVYHLGPLSIWELGESFRMDQALETGTLPGVYLETSEAERIRDLRSYASIYLKEEIQAEALTRNLEGFSRFLFVAAHAAGQFLDLFKLASEAQIPRASASRYFEILEDTLVMNRCLSFSKSLRRRLIQHPKFYFFDTGVLNALLGNFKASPDRRGLLFEHFFFNQLVAGAYSQDKEIHISSYRTEHGAEVDFIIEDENRIWAVELKASSSVGTGDLTGLRSFADFYGKRHEARVAYLGENEKVISGIRVRPCLKVLEEILG